MSFVPPRCPNTSCPKHEQPTPGFCRPRGFYVPKCRPEGVPRFRCSTCRRGFSRQTFRHDYRDHRPDVNTTLFLLLASGVGLRQSARVLEVNPRSVQDKQRKMASMFELLHGNLCPKLPPGRSYLLDEEETYEGASIRPLTMPVLIEKETWFVVATAVGSIRRLAKAGSVRRARQERDEQGTPRPDQSSQCVRQVLDALARKVAEGSVLLHTDQKASYGTIASSVFGDRLVHETTAGTLVRSTHNPLFSINTTLAMTRDNCGRLRRKSWLVTKKAERLQNHLLLFTIYRNYVRRRFNRDQETDTPAKFLGLLPRNLHRQEVLAWRQDWGDLSIHPMSSRGSHTVRQAVPA
jgi:transposase-like protein